MGRSTVLSLPLQLEFPGHNILGKLGCSFREEGVSVQFHFLPSNWQNRPWNDQKG
jgi:hypothetical protein